MQVCDTTVGFTIKSAMKNAKVIGPPTAGAFKERQSKPTAFRKFYSAQNKEKIEEFDVRVFYRDFVS